DKIRGSFFPIEIYGRELLCDRPELADVKITDHCSFNCEFCYQNSGPDGKHADTDKVFQAIDALAELEVFEIALGGGDPVDHPDFVKIVDYARKKGIIPNFSTRNLDFLYSQDFIEITEKIGSIGFTVTDVSDLKKLSDAQKFLCCLTDLKTPRIKVHIVENSLDYEDLKKVAEFFRDYRFRIIFLGVKEIGRGKVLKHRPWPENFIELLPKYPYEIDTQMAANSIEKWEKAGFNTSNVEIHEGLQSLYVDCCAQKIGKSSYQPETSKKINFSQPGLSRKFQRFFEKQQQKIITDENMWLLNPFRDR
ncbi:MAG: radical SAM protein, partial [Candidatus Riflebacteria bacterium]